MAPRLRSVPTVIPPGPQPTAPQQQMMPPQASPSGWWWDGARWVCDPCDDFQPSPPCPPSGWPTPCPPWFPPPAGQAPWYPGANAGVSFSQSPPVNPIRGNFWWDGVMLHMFDGAAWVNIGPTPSSGVFTGPSPPPNPVAGQLWFDGVVLFVWDGIGWIPSGTTRSFVQPTAPLHPNPGDTWWDGSHQWIWDGASWQLIGGSSGPTPTPGTQSITPVMIPWATTVVPDFSQFINAYITVTGNFILGSPINVTPGQTGIIKLTQGVTGGTWSVSPGWYFLGGTGAPPLSTGVNAKDLLHYYVGEANIVYGELHTDFMAAPSTPPTLTKTPFGNMTLNGGIAAAFDGTNTKASAAAARGSVSGQNVTLDAFVGQQFSVGQKILSAAYWPATDYTWNASAGQGSNYTLTINLRGSTTAPSTGSSGVLLATLPVPTTGQLHGSQSLVSTDQNTLYTYAWIEMVMTGSGLSSAATMNVFCAQLVIDTHG